MDPDRWQEIKRIYNEALELEPDRRAAYLEEACAGDESLRVELNELLRSGSEPGYFWKVPAIELAARALAEEEAVQPRQELVGCRLFHYHIVEKIGEGGMGEVYRAEDTNLSRHVAVKILPDHSSYDPERVARFAREAKVLASLNHPNIAAIHGLEEADGKRFIVMELVEGQTLAHRLLRGPLPVDEALEVCRQIAEGLEAAHEKGVIHRDLKPANVMITPDDKLKILDFGLARTFHDQPSEADQTHSPTITDAMTLAGTILGTAAYMSPEQARGRQLDNRADIWAFGVVMFECLTGLACFVGETVTDVLAAVIRAEPDWASLPAAAPSRLSSLLRRCLVKERRQRLQAIGDARVELEELAAAGVEAEPSTAAHVTFKDTQPPTLMVFAASAEECRYQQTLAELEEVRKTVPGRDLLVVRILDWGENWLGDARLDIGRACALKERWAIGLNHFAVILIGEDGRQKLRSNEVLPACELLRRIGLVTKP